MESLEATIGYQFSDAGLREEALTHPSVVYESRQDRRSNQRLEYLGDAVVQLVLTDELFRSFPHFDEGRLTKLRSRLVSREGLCRWARSIALGEHLILGKGEAAHGGRDRPSNLADAFEALVGAIYLDGGFPAAREFLLGNFSESICKTAALPSDDNPKGQLQEELQALSSSSPRYEILSQEGPDHSKSFVAEVSWEGRALGSGSGFSKKEAETAAAAEALRRRLWDAPKAG